MTITNDNYDASTGLRIEEEFDLDTGTLEMRVDGRIIESRSLTAEEIDRYTPVPPPPTAEERIADLEAKLIQAEPTPDDIPATANPLSAQVAQLSATVEALTGELDRLEVVDAATIEATAKDATASKGLIAKVADAFGISWDEADKVRLTDAKRWGEWLTKLGIGGDPKADGDIGAVEAIK